MSEQLLLIAGMALVTYVPRVLPLLFLANRQLHPGFLRWLEMVPPAVLGALLAPELLLGKAGGESTLSVSLGNIFLLAAIPTFLVGWLFKNFFLTVITGMICVALLRFFGA